MHNNQVNNDHKNDGHDHSAMKGNVCTMCNHEHKDEGGTCACGCGK